MNSPTPEIHPTTKVVGFLSGNPVKLVLDVKLATAKAIFAELDKAWDESYVSVTFRKKYNIVKKKYGCV